MSKVKLPDFLHDPAQYQQAESIWLELWGKVVRALGQETDWQTPWMNTHFNDGTPFRDGNPIFSAVSPSRHLGVRVIQVEPEDDPHELGEWTDTFAQGDPEAIKELVIHCVLSEETLRQAEELMKRWIAKEAGQSRCAS